MNRRKFLSQSLMAAASFGVGSTFRRNGRFELARSAEAAPALTPYPVLLIMAAGGMDPCMQLVATPNGRFGNVNIQNRLSGTGQFAETKTGIRYVVPTVLPAGKTDMLPHLEQVALVRAIRGYTCHGGRASMLFGDQSGSSASGMRFGRLPWGSVLADQFRARGNLVRKPFAFAYWRPAVLKTELYLDYLAWATQSPNPAAVPDRIQSVPAFFRSLSSEGLPKAFVQQPTYGLIDALDRDMPAPTQPNYTDRFAAANSSANDALANALSGPIWPPPPAVLSALGITATQANADFIDPDYGQMTAMAFQALNNKLSHVIAFQNLGLTTPGGITWDTHSRNIDGQIANGKRLWPALGKLIALMKNTPSPIVSGKTMFDTTNIWVQSEMGRTVGADVNVKATDGTGHWGPGSSIFLGGRFKRGIAIGDFTPDFNAAPVDPVTGRPGGTELRMNNMIATVMKAAGGDPSAFTKAAPVDALLDMSL